MPTVDLPAKVCYAVDEMARTFSLTDVIGEDHLKRLFARRIAIRLDDFVDLAPQWKNQLKSAGVDRVSISALHERLKRLAADHQEVLKKVRLQPGAHRLQANIAEQYEFFQLIDRSTLGVIVSDCTEIVNMLSSAAGVPIGVFPSTTLSCADKARVTDATATREGIYFSTDDLGYGRKGSIAKLSIGPMQNRVDQATGIIEALAIGWRVSNSIHDTYEYKRDVDLQIVTDLISLYEIIYEGNQLQGITIPPAIDLWKGRGFEQVELILPVLKAKLSQVEHDELTEIRNRIGAHLDRDKSGNLPLIDLLHLIDDYDREKLWVYTDTLCAGIKDGARTSIHMRSMSIHNQPVPGAIALDGEIHTAYDDQ